MSPRIFFIVSIMLAVCAIGRPRSQSHLKYLSGFQRLNTSCTDYYFSCKVTGVFMQWFYNNEPLSGFIIGNPGQVVVDSRSKFEYISTLLSLELLENGQATFVSVLVVSFNGTQDFDVTCSSQIESMTIAANQIDNVGDSSDNDGIILDYVLSDQIVEDKNKTHIFVCGVPNSFQFLETEGSAIGFSSGDPIGEDKTVLSDDRKIVDLQGVLIARDTFFQSISLLFVTDSSDVTVTCFYGIHQVQLSSFSSASTDSPNSISTGGTTGITTHESTDVTDGTTRNMAVYVTIIIPASVLIPVFLIAAAYCCWRGKKFSKNRRYNVSEKKEHELIEVQNEKITSDNNYSNKEESLPEKVTPIGREETIPVVGGNIAATEEITLHSSNSVEKPVDGTQPSWKETCKNFAPIQCSEEQDRNMQECDQDIVQPGHQHIFVPTYLRVVPFTDNYGEKEDELTRNWSTETSAVCATSKAFCIVFSEGKPKLIKDNFRLDDNSTEKCHSGKAIFTAGTYARKCQIAAGGSFVMKQNSRDCNECAAFPCKDNEVPQSIKKEMVCDRSKHEEHQHKEILTSHQLECVTPVTKELVNKGDDTIFQRLLYCEMWFFRLL